MKKRYLFFILLCFIIFCAAGQRREVDSVRKVLTTELPDSSRIVALIRLTNGYVQIWPDSALLYSSMALKVIDETKIDKYLPHVLGARGDAYMVKGEYATAKPYFKKIIVEAQNRDKRDLLLAGVYSSLSTLFRYQTDYDSSIFYSKKILDLRLGADPNRAYQGAYNMIAICYYYLGNYPLSLQYQLKSLNEAEKRRPVNYTDIAEALLNIGEVYGKMQDYPRSLQYYRRALKLTTSDGNNELSANCYASMAQTYYLIDRSTLHFIFHFALCPSMNGLERNMDWRQTDITWLCCTKRIKHGTKP